MRIRGAKTELEEAGIETEGMVESTATLRQEIMALSGVDIMLDKNNFKSTYQIMDELSQKWENLSDIQQATITELMAGKHQGNVFASLMTNFQTAREALDASLNSSGSAMREHAKWSESLEARLNKLKSTWQSLSQTFMGSDFLKGGLDLIIGFVNALDKLIDTIGILGVSIAGLGIKKIFSTAKGVGGLKSLTDILPLLSTAFPNAAKGVGVFTTALKGGVGIAGVLKAALSGLWTVVAAHPILAVVAAVGLGIAAFAKFHESASELAEKVDEVTSKFQEQHTELVKNKSSFESQAARYGQLAKGVNDLGENVSLTADEYAEYQDIVNSIADQVPSLIQGYDAQGNAILNYKGNVKELTSAYEELIKKQNESVLKGDAYKDIVKDFKNDFSNFNGENAKTSVDSVNLLEDALNGKYSREEIEKVFGHSENTVDIANLLKEAGLAEDVHWYSTHDTYIDAIADAITNNPDEVREAINGFKSDVDATAEGMRSAAQAALSNAFDFSDSKYKNIGEKTKSLVRQIVGNFDAEQFDKIVDSGKTVEEYINNMLDSFKNMSSNDARHIEHAFDIKTRFNNDEITLGEYTHVIKSAKEDIELLGLDEDIESQIKLAIDDEQMMSDYNALITRLTSEEYDIKINDFEARQFLNGLTSSEYQATVDLIESDNVDFKSAIQNYKKTLDEAEEAGVDFSKTVFGNIDTNARQTLEWTSENLEKYKDELMSWEPKDASWENVKKSLEGSISTVMGTVSSYEVEGGGEIDFAFSPMLQTDKGVEVLSKDTVDAYFEELISKAVYNGYWNVEEFISLDAKGLEVDGKKIKGILADIRSTAQATSQQMHFVGKDGALALAEAEINAIIKKQAELNKAMNFTIDIEARTQGLESLNTALAESKSAAGLTAESISALKSRYQDLDGYDAASLFEETASGIRVNSTELTKLEKEYKDFNKQEIDKTLETLTNEYNDLTDEIANCTDDQKNLSDLYDKRSGILDQINNVASLAAQYEGLTSAYNEWIRAQEAGQDRDPYENILSGREDIEDEMSRGWLDDAAVEYLELLSGKDLSGEGIDAQIKAYKELDETIGNTKYSIWDFFTEDDEGNSTSDGVFNFFDTVKSVAGETAAWIDENGKYNFDFEGFEYNGKTGDAAIADVLGTSEELVQILLRAAEDAGFIINIESDYTDLADAVNEAEKANDRMKELGATTYTFNFDTTDIDSLNEQIDEAKTMLSNLKNEDGTLKVGVSEEDYRQARDIIYSLILQKQRLDDSAILHVNTEQAETDIEVAISKLQDFKEYANTLEVKTAVGADTSKVTSDIQTVLEDINGLDPKIKAGLGLNTTEVQAAIDSVQADIKAGVAIKQEDIDVINAAISSISNDAMVSLGLDTTLIDNYKTVEQEANGVVNWDNNIEKVTAWINQKHEASGTVKWDDDTSNLKTTYTGKGVIYWNPSEANGTANVNGTTGGKAFKQGDWGIKNSGRALGGELGTEILVRNGRWYTIGDGGAEFFNYRKGDIIFNHRQTEELFANGKVTSGGGRGKAFVGGNAFSSGSSGSGNLKDTIKGAIKEANKESGKTDGNDSKSSKSTVGSNGSGASKNAIKEAVRDSAKSKSSSKKETKEEFEETFDWVEIAISRIEREIDNLDQKANRTYKSWSSRNKALTSEIGKVGDEIDLQQKAYDRYIKEANSVGLSSSWAEKVRNGEIDIESIEDEGLAEKIKDYQNWYEKALSCKDAIEDLKDTEAELYKQRFENIQSQYDGILQGYEHTETMLNEYISQAEAQGHIVSEKYYQALINNEEQNIAQLKKEQSALIEARNEAEANGIDKNSQDWLDMCAEIDAVTQAIEEGTTSIIEYNNAIRDIEWEKFDLIQERISDITAESEFLIELMSNDKLFDDKGKLTGQGAATMGLHALNYNTAMYQADDYDEEIAQLDKQIAKDPYDQNLINRRRELIEAQRESILEAENEKQAIKDLVEEGINLELDALQELIDKKNEELESEKELYEYQKKVQEQTESIASLRKQMAAYENDDSEETKAKIQELKISLEEAETELKEAEWDKYISDTSALLDTLYTDYETILNARLDNVDFLLQQVIDGINIASGALGSEGAIASALGSEGAIASALGAEGTLASALGVEGAIASAIVNAMGENGSIKSILNTEVTGVGTTLSTAMDNIWSVGEGNAKSVLTTYGEGFQGKQTTTNEALGSIKADVAAMVDDIDKDAQKKVEAPKTPPSSKSDPTKGNNSNNGNKGNNNENKQPSKPTITDDTIKGIAAAIWVYGSNSGWGNNPFRENKLTSKIGTSNAKKVQDYINKHGSNGDLYNFWIQKGKNLDKYKYNAFKTGAKEIDVSQLAWTQENGQEYIIRPSDGAILTPVAKGDSVLNATASGNIWNMANNPTEFIRDNLKLDASNVPNGANVQSNLTQHFENINFNMPNVKNYSELLSELKDDPKFNKLILAMTLDQVAGKSKLAKGKAIR